MNKRADSQINLSIVVRTINTNNGPFAFLVSCKKETFAGGEEISVLVFYKSTFRKMDLDMKDTHNTLSM